MRCSQVDLLNNTVCLHSGETKNGEGRIVALTDECRFLSQSFAGSKQPEDFLLTGENGQQSATWFAAALPNEWQ